MRATHTVHVLTPRLPAFALPQAISSSASGAQLTFKSSSVAVAAQQQPPQEEGAGAGVIAELEDQSTVFVLCVLFSALAVAAALLGWVKQQARPAKRRFLVRAACALLNATGLVVVG